MENKTNNIYQKLLAIQVELEPVAKNLEVKVGNGQYKAVGEVDVLKAVKPLEAKYGVYSYPCSREIVESGELVSIDKNGVERKQLFERIKTTYRFVNVDKPEEYIDIASYGDGIDSGDKSVGKAMTYADKYALLKAYKIQTGDDPDAVGSETLSSFTKKPQVQRELTLDEAKNTITPQGKKLSECSNDQLQFLVDKKTRFADAAQMVLDDRYLDDHMPTENDLPF